VLDSLRSTYHYYKAQPVPNAFILGTLRRLGEELVAFIQHQACHLADAARYAQQLEALGIPRFNSWECFQGCLVGDIIKPAQLTTDTPLQDELQSIDAAPEALQVPTSWMVRQYDAVLHYLVPMQHKQVGHFAMESDQQPMSLQSVAARRYWPTPMEEQLIVTAGQMAMLKALKQQLQVGHPLHFMVPVDRGLDALWDAMRWAIRMVRGTDAPPLLDDGQAGSMHFNSHLHHDAFRSWYLRWQDLEPVLHNMGLQACYLLAATRMAQAEEPGPVTQRHLEVVGAIADLDVNAILDGLRAPHGPTMGHWPFREAVPNHSLTEDELQPVPRQWELDGRGRLLARLQGEQQNWATVWQHLVQPLVAASEQLTRLRQQGQGAGAEGEDLFTAAS
jgi:hypothetical protein